jgi:superfamily II RNA helicase
MTDVAEIDANVNNSVEEVKKSYKTPEYVLLAHRRYYAKKMQNPEFVIKEKERLQKYKKPAEKKIEIEKCTKVPEYIKRANKAYIERNKDNSEFMEKMRGYQLKYRDANIDRIREADKLRKREMRARKKAEKEEQLKQQINQQTNINNDSSVSELVEDTVADTVAKLKL